MTTIDDILGNMDEDFEFKVVKDERSDLTIEEKKQLGVFLEKLLLDNIHLLGDFSYKINKKMSKSVTLSIFDFFKQTDSLIKKAPIYKDGELLGESCFFCTERVRCLSKEETPCSVEDHFTNEYFKKLRNRFDFEPFNRDLFIKLIEKEGFEQILFMGIKKIDGWEKGRMGIYL